MPSRSRRASARAEAPTEDRLEETWRRYYASIFNPARLKVKAMQAEMPKKYWRNLPEASLIKPLIEGAGRATERDDRNGATAPHKAQKRLEPPMTRRHGRRRHRNAARGSRAIAAPARSGRTRPRPCSAKARRRPRSCWSASSPATRKTSPASPSSAPPARCSIARWKRPASTAARSTSPTRSSISNSCRAERSACTRSRTRRRSRRAGNGTNANWPRSNPIWWWRWARPRRKACSARSRPINKNRGRLIDLDDGTRALVTVHPSYLLRLPDADAKAREYQRFVEDLKIAAGAAAKISTCGLKFRQSGSRKFP